MTTKSKNTPDPKRLKRKSWKQQTHAMAEANGKLTALLATAKGDFEEIRKLLLPQLAGMRLVIKPSSKKLRADIEQILEVIGEWDNLVITKKTAATGEDQGEIPARSRKVVAKPPIKTL